MMNDLPSFANLVVCALVTLFGLYWLRDLTDRYRHEHQYLARAFGCWWFSWAVWTVTWAVITFSGLEHRYPRRILVLSDLNALLLIMVYLHMTRGTSYRVLTSLIDFCFVALSIAAGYFVFYLLVQDRFDALQIGWGLCLSAISTFLVGWAFLLRYGTNAVLIVGFTYAFAQPLAFESILAKEVTDQSAAILQAFKLILAAFKIPWALVVLLFFLQRPLGDEPVVAQVPARAAHLPGFFPLPVVIQSLVLILAVGGVSLYAGLRALPADAKDELVPVLGAISALVAIVTGLVKLYGWIKEKTGRYPPAAAGASALR